MSNEANINGLAQSAYEPLIGRESGEVPGHFGDPLTVEHMMTSRGGIDQHPTHPLFLCLHGWGSNEQEMADIMRLIAPYNDFVALRGPLTLAEAAADSREPGNYAWLHGSMPVGEDLDYDAYAAAQAVDAWVAANIPDNRAIVPLGFSQGGLVAVHLLRINPERYRAVISLSGFNAPGQVPGTAPADDRLADLDIPVFYTYGKNDGVVPKYELFATAAWLEEHTWLKTKSYHGLDHNVSLEEFADLRQWLLDNDITSGVL
ncbi:alpha/beta hydrolase [Bifidobacterium felsineum]|uniref:alpha/beta hydrolase n=1 Tax=Bifidobacterium felsineum TaxID=2045440 RepID=UPI001BDD5E13|nr:alpha/beta hydrolase-fold protein [Bifidobacterium felsineum]MBT1164754.1 esterase [Bifidobacterium felsineum]